MFRRMHLHNLNKLSKDFLHKYTINIGLVATLYCDMPIEKQFFEGEQTYEYYQTGPQYLYFVSVDFLFLTINFR